MFFFSVFERRPGRRCNVFFSSGHNGGQATVAMFFFPVFERRPTAVVTPRTAVITAAGEHWYLTSPQFAYLE
jgi:hypothetical protein